MTQPNESLSYNVDLGSPFPLGASLTDTGCNFAVYSPDASAIVLCLFERDTEQPIGELVLHGKTGNVWHIHVQGIRSGDLYGYRVQRVTSNLHSAPIDKLLIDPYAKALSRAMHWNARQYQDDSQFMVPKSVVINEQDYPSERPKKPQVSAHQRVVYEAHVKGMTQLHPDVPSEHQGKYLGMAHPSVIEHLVSLGITTVQLMPVAAFMPEPYITEKGMTNYWGYNPVNFFSPEPRYGNDDPIGELITLVDALHGAGLEVILDVVFNHTAESGKGGQVLSFKGLSPYQSYLREQLPTGELVYSNHSGCGNTVHTAHPRMTTLILDAMRHWVSFIGVDGFRFDLAPCLGREPQAFNPNAGLLRAIAQDPQLQGCVLIAEPWDIGPGGYQLGQFSPAWLEVNDKFRDTVRGFWRGDEGMTAELATRLMGSRDVFHKGRRHCNSSVNNITYHDGFTLQDLVSYNERHNLANGEDNRDGHGHNLSANYGVEGATQDLAVLKVRERQKRNLFATLVLSQGTPHILGGDELSKTQQGNNNAYCQDNELNWLDWHLDKRKQDFLNYCRYVIAIRQESEILSNLQLEDDRFHLHTNVELIKWYRPDGGFKQESDWQSAENKAFAIEIKGVAADHQAEHWLICFNAFDKDVQFSIPTSSDSGGWSLILDTRYSTIGQQPKICMKHMFLQAKRTIAIFKGC